MRATLRIFYAFLVPIFGGRLWTTMSTASLMIPAFGIGYAVQNPDTPYLIFLVLAAIAVLLLIIGVAVWWAAGPVVLPPLIWVATAGAAAALTTSPPATVR